MTVTHTNTKIKIDWYTKPTSSGRFVNYHSITPLKYKISAINNLVDRCYSFSEKENLAANMIKIEQLLTKNSYPIHFIKKHINKRLYHLQHKDRSNENMSGQKNGPESSRAMTETCMNANNNELDRRTNNEKKYIAVRYYAGLSESLQHLLKKYNINIAHKPLNNKKLFTSTKDPIALKNRTHTVYSIKCEDCEGTYIGQSKQYIDNRIKEHKYSTKKASENMTALAKHAWEKKHSFNFQNYQILEQEHNYNKRLFKEMWHIKRDSHSINDKKDTMNLSVIYRNLIN